MVVFRLRTILFVCLPCVFQSFFALINQVQAQAQMDIKGLHFLGGYEIPFGYRFKNTTVGGLSGIDYDAVNKRYYLISDDKGAVNAARFYTTAIFITPKGIDSVRFTGVTNLLQANGQQYPTGKTGSPHPPDPEAIRYNPLTKTLTWSSEGERIINNTNNILQDPAVNNISLKGKYVNSFLLPDNFKVQATEKGSRQNGSLEGLTFADNYTKLFISSEEPLYEDGPRAGIGDNNAFIRIAQLNVADRMPAKQFAYKLEPVAHPPYPANAFMLNGVTDVLSIGKNKLLVVERSFSSGRLACTVKLFIADLSKATDIKTISSLKSDTAFVAATKKLLLNMDDLGIFTDNIEGVTRGPILPNGHKTLLFIADNNFNPLAKSQLLLFEVLE